MQDLIQIFLWIPFLGFLLSLVSSEKNEKLLSNSLLVSSALQFVLILIFSAFWIIKGESNLFRRHITLYSSPAFEFFISYYFDKITLVFGLVGSVITFFVARFSKYYMHRDEGYKRYFATLFMFFLGYNLTVFAGNFETLFIGWEFLGVCSFLLISFYRDRYLPAKNALKVISIYRLGDVCLILVMWVSHHLFHKNITLVDIDSMEFPATDIGLFTFMLIMLLFASLIKSALVPFSSWLPRAMEGPTSSSAVFYGSLSVHIGIFLLMRTYNLWIDNFIFKVVLIVIGITTAFITSNIAKVQSTVKTQIAYASIAQIGLMLIEVALGFHILALIHFSCNAMFRTYQLLISPSVMNYKIHDMFFHFKEGNEVKSSRLFNSLYILNIKEWNLDNFQFNFLWRPFKSLGNGMNFVSDKVVLVLFSLLFIVGIYYTSIEHTVYKSLDNVVTILFSILAITLILKSFAARGNARDNWLFLILGQSFLTLSVVVNEHVPLHQIVIYLSGILLAGVVGYFVLLRLKTTLGDITLDKWHGYSHDKPWLSFIFLLSCLALLGFPFTPTFLGMDLLFTHIHSDQYLLIIFTSLSFIFIEIAALRIYARLFMGQHKMNDKPIAYRSS